jgi:uncharacterized protein (TIGR02391 family)
LATAPEINRIRVHLAAARAALRAKWLQAHECEPDEDFHAIDQAIIHCLDQAGIDIAYGKEIDAVEALESELEDATQVDALRWRMRRRLIMEYVERGRVIVGEDMERVVRFLNLADRKLRDAPKQTERQPQTKRDRLASTLLHPVIAASSWPQYENGHIKDAVLNAFLAIGDLMRKRTGLDVDGKSLAELALSPKDPYLVLSDLDSESGRNDQAGFMQILCGAFVGVRNVKAHSLEHDLDDAMALQYLIFASLLARRISEATATAKCDAMNAMK